MFGAAPRSSKRRTEEEPEGEQRITKRLARMRIDNPHLQPVVSSPKTTQDVHPSNDRMFLDDTKDKIYIHDLASEIAQIEAEEPQGIFLPDIEKKISAIPQRLLENQSNNANTQMVLYQVPSSISVPKEQDHVRKTIIASRARTREKQAEEVKKKDSGKSVHSENHMNGMVPDQMEEQYDPDAMDLG